MLAEKAARDKEAVKEIEENAARERQERQERNDKVRCKRRNLTDTL